MTRLLPVAIVVAASVLAFVAVHPAGAAKRGCTAYMVELTFPSGVAMAPFKFPTGVKVVPDVEPCKDWRPEGK